MVRYRVREVRVKPEIWWRSGRGFAFVEDGGLEAYEAGRETHVGWSWYMGHQLVPISGLE